MSVTGRTRLFGLGRMAAGMVLGLSKVDSPARQSPNRNAAIEKLRNRVPGGIAK